MMNRFRLTPLQAAMHVGAVFPLMRLIFDLVTGSLGPNPIQSLEQRTGRTAVTLLLLSLSCTPLNTLFGWRELLLRRRALGLYAFLYACLHVLVFLDLDYGLDWHLILNAVFEKRFILVGALSFFLLIPLAITSFDIWVKRLRKNWKRLHRLVYLIAPLVILHFGWARKGDFLRLQGDVLQPLVYGAMLVLLLALRLSPLRKAAVSFRNRILARRTG